MATPIGKPDAFPRYASVDTPNGPSGENNVLEPSEPKKDIGWNFGEFPPRDYMNWIHRKNYEWVKYLQQTSGRRNIRFFMNQI